MAGAALSALGLGVLGEGGVGLVWGGVCAAAADVFGHGAGGRGGLSWLLVVTRFVIYQCAEQEHFVGFIFGFHGGVRAVGAGGGVGHDAAIARGGRAGRVEGISEYSDAVWWVQDSDCRLW